MATIPEGYAIIPPRGRENAIKVLKAADDAGVDQLLVRTHADGFLVPLAVEEKYHELYDVEGEPPVEQPADQGNLPKEEAPAPEKSADESTSEEVEVPKGNASREDWLAYAEKQPGYNAETDAELGRDELREKFAPKN